MAGAEVYGSVEDVPFVPSAMRYVLSIFNLRAVRNFRPTLPTSRRLLVRGHKLAAINGSDRDIFPEHDFRAQFQEVEIFVRDQPLVSTLRTNCKHQSDCTLAKSGRVKCRDRALPSINPAVAQRPINPQQARPSPLN